MVSVAREIVQWVKKKVEGSHTIYRVAGCRKVKEEQRAAFPSFLHQISIPKS
jgi:predicted ester cyclase